MTIISDKTTWQGPILLEDATYLPELTTLTLEESTVVQNALFTQAAGSNIKFYGSTFQVLNEYRILGGELEHYFPAPSELTISGGTLRKQSSPEGVVDLFVQSHNGSTLAIEEGRLTLKEGGFFRDTLITIAEGDNGEEPTLWLDATQDDGGPAPIFTFGEHVEITGEGELRVNAAIATDSILELAENTFLESLGTLQGSGTFVVNENSELSIVEAASVTRKISTTLHNQGTISQSGAGLILTGGRGQIHNQGQFNLQGDRYDWGATWVEHPDYDVIDLYVEEYDTLSLSDVTSHMSSTANGGEFFNDGGTVSLVRGAGELDTYADITTFFRDQNGTVQVGEETHLLLSGGGQFDGTTFTICSSPDIDYLYYERPTLTLRGITENYQLKNVTFSSEGAGGVVQLDGKITADGTVQLGQETIWGSLIGQSLLAGADYHSQFVNPTGGRLIATTGLSLPPEILEGIPLISDYPHQLSTRLVNQGLMETAPGYIDIELTSSGILDNQGVFKFNARDGADFNVYLEGYNGSFRYESDSDGWSRIKGDGTFLNHLGGEVIKIGDKESFIEVDFQNLGGHVQVKDGLLALEAGGINDNGSFSIEDAGTLRFVEGRYHFKGTDGTLDNNGVLESDGADWVIDDRLNLTGTIRWLDRDAAHSSMSGTGTLRNLGDLTMGETGGLVDMNIHRFENAGIFNLNGGYLTLHRQFVNQSIFNLQQSGDILSSAGAEFINQGKFRARSNGSRKVTAYLSSDAGSLIDVDQGKLRLEGGSFLHGNSIKVKEGATLQFHVGRPNQTHRINGAQLDNHGTLELGRGSERGPVLTVEGNGFTLNGQVIWHAGQIDGSAPLRNQGELRLEETEWLGTDLHNQATGLVVQRTDLALRSGVELVNEGQWILSKGTRYGLQDTIRPYLRNQSGNRLINSGDVRMTASNIVSIGVEIENTGLFKIEQGELRLKQSFIQSGEGQLVLAGGQVKTTAGIELLSGELIAEGGSLTGALNLDDVDVKLGNESGEIQTLALSQYRDTDATQLTFDIDQSGHDQISITSGSAIFDGVINLNLTQAAVQSLTVGDRFQIITGAASLSSDGVDLNYVDISEALAFVLEETTHGIDLVVVERNTNSLVPLLSNVSQPSLEHFNRIEGTDGVDILTGSSQDDWLIGGNADDTLWDYSAGDDYFEGGAGNDRILAGQGDDTLDGGLGDDVYQGGAGSDVFVFNPVNGRDTVTDFEILKDRIDLGSAWRTEGLNFEQSGKDTLLQIQGKVIAQFRNINAIQLEDALSDL